MKQQFLKDRTGVIRISAFSSNVQLVPSSATIILKTPTGGELQTSTAASINAVGEMTFALTTTHTENHNLNFIAEWTYIIGADTLYESQLFDVVKTPQVNAEQPLRKRRGIGPIRNYSQGGITCFFWELD